MSELRRSGNGVDLVPLRAALAGRRVLLTGHSGFKGGWMAVWLRELGAEVIGLSLPPSTTPSLHDSIDLPALVDGRFADIRSEQSIAAALRDVDADAVVHMAAHAIVRTCHANPVDAYMTNVVGTAIVLNAARAMPRLRAALVVTSDKCYANHGQPVAFRETDPLGGTDIYSSSKAAQELVAEAYRHNWFSHPGGALLATARAGNVIGGGDWADDRLVPDIVRAARAGVPALIRSPASTRPWQHVLEPLSGYLMLLSRLMQGDTAAVGAWNFGPDDGDSVDVATLTRHLTRAWGHGAPEIRLGQPPATGPREAVTLAIDSSKARQELGWRPQWDLPTAVQKTVEWYRLYSERPSGVAALTRAQIADYVEGRLNADPVQAAGDYRRCG